MCNFLEYKSQKLVYRRYASLYFCFCIEADDNELITLEVIQRFVCCLDSYFGNVCELDIVYGMTQAYALLDELIINGEMGESKQRSVVEAVRAVESLEQDENLRENLL